jgi:hypothetical protein
VSFNVFFVPSSIPRGPPCAAADDCEGSMRCPIFQITNIDGQTRLASFSPMLTGPALPCRASDAAPR